mmetsp:Transcript_15928/g.32704  ORF Transcript_15928/g.32704 Transcript_15928/m.32704 type:complete len:82 (-) Transcript_15928:306-551(-)
MVGTGNIETLTTTLSPLLNNLLYFPSKLTAASALESSGTLICSVQWSGKIIGLVPMTWGATAVKSIQGTLGCTTLPPAAML